ncbi:6-bladed beta-propeller [Algoriphagus antarcticus]|uniref:6-bladed beta-propeller protein n=1 Tax=Algoriphagus antarcticus TaxID=238540 RepID=A0A3E0DNX9_9BACT|nr:6-bladed beta-propeller [Algoriphagus antarcticus]REG84546.1 6-bladed beta-propeller protein [Algoriphagus antarcticus]
MPQLNLRFRLFLVALLILLFEGCTHPAKSNIPVVNIPKNAEDLYLDEFGKSIEYIQLETKPGSYISSIMDVKKFGNYFLIKDRSGKVLVFTDEGKFVRKLGEIGDGPGEYKNAYSLAVNENLGIIYLGSFKKIQMYSKNLEFIKEIKLPYFANYLNVSNDDLLLITNIDSEKKPSGNISNTILYRLDQSLELKDSTLFRSVLIKDNVLRGFTTQLFISNTGDDTYLYTPVFYDEFFLRDTLYQIKSDSIVPTSKFNFVDFTFSDKGEKNISIKNIVSSKSYYICHYARDKELMFFIYDKLKNKGFHTRKGLIDEFGEAQFIYPLDLSNDRFYFIIKSEFISSDKEELNPTIGIVELK